MESIHQMLEQFPVLENVTVRKLLLSAAVVFILWSIHLLILPLVARRTDDARSRYMWRKASLYVLAVIGIFLVALIWYKGMKEITTYLGLLSAGIAIALRDIFTNIAGWVFLIWVRPLGVGDRIQIGGRSGDVIDIGFFHISLMEIGNWVQSDQSTGRILNIPNGMIFSEVFANYSRGFRHIWHEIPVLITFESDWEKAKRIINDIAARNAERYSTEAEQWVREASSRFLLFQPTLTPTVYTSVRDSGVLLTLRYLTEPRRRRDSEQTMWEEILRAFAAESDIDFAYPTTRFYDNPVEGKAGYKPE